MKYLRVILKVLKRKKKGSLSKSWRRGRRRNFHFTSFITFFFFCHPSQLNKIYCFSLTPTPRATRKTTVCSCRGRCWWSLPADPESPLLSECLHCSMSRRTGGQQQYSAVHRQGGWPDTVCVHPFIFVYMTACLCVWRHNWQSALQWLAIVSGDAVHWQAALVAQRLSSHRHTQIKSCLTETAWLFNIKKQGNIEAEVVSTLALQQDSHRLAGSVLGHSVPTLLIFPCILFMLFIRHFICDPSTVQANCPLHPCLITERIGCSPSNTSLFF